MRDWNVVGVIFGRGLALFVAYLWGIETRLYNILDSIWLQFVAYLWGIETSDSGGKLEIWALFVAYLWGIETREKRLQPAAQEGL